MTLPKGGPDLGALAGSGDVRRYRGPEGPKGNTGAAGPVGPAGTTYLGTAIGNVTINGESCSVVNFGYGGLVVGDTAVMVPDYTTTSAWLTFSPSVVKVANQLPVDVCNHWDQQVSMTNKTYYFWQIKK